MKHIITLLLLSFGLSACTVMTPTKFALQGNPNDGSKSKFRNDDFLGGGVISQSLECRLDESTELPKRIIRLTGTDFLNSVKSVFGTNVTMGTNPFTEKGHVSRFSTDALYLRVNASHTRDLQEVNKQLADDSLAQWKTEFSCLDQFADTCKIRFINSVGLRLFRRPLNGEEVANYTTFMNEAGAQFSIDEAISLTLQAMLASPHFVFRWETGTQLSSYEIASALSYLAAQAPPDGRLMALAAQNQLQNRQQIMNEFIRLIRGDNYNNVVKFFREYLEYGELIGKEMDTSVFPNYTVAVGQALVENADDMVRDAFATGKTLAELLTTQEIVSRPNTDYIYGVQRSVASQGAQKFIDPRRSGILTQPAFLAAQAEAFRTSPVRVGSVIRSNLLCAVVPGAPANLADVIADGQANIGVDATVRETLAVHTENPVCYTCHQYLEPIGLGFEIYSAIGQFRTLEKGKPVDDSGEVRGVGSLDGPFNGPRQFTNRVALSDQVNSCFSTHMLAYLGGVYDRFKCTSGTDMKSLTLEQYLAVLVADYLSKTRR